MPKIFYKNIKRQVLGPTVDSRNIVKHRASGTIAQTAFSTPGCSCHTQAALVDVGTLHNKQGQRAGGHFPCAISLCVNEACPEDTQLHPFLQKLSWTSCFLLIYSQWYLLWSIKQRGGWSNHIEMGNGRWETSVLCLLSPGTCPSAQAGACLKGEKRFLCLSFLIKPLCLAWDNIHWAREKRARLSHAVCPRG